MADRLKMPLYIDLTTVDFSVGLPAEEKVDQNGKQRFNKDGAPMWKVQLIALNDKMGAEVIDVTVAGVKPEVQRGQLVIPEGLEALPWNTNGRSGVAFRATQIRIREATSKPKAA